MSSVKELMPSVAPVTLTAFGVDTSRRRISAAAMVTIAR